ncbi:MAG: hypothetical protein KC933_00920 [Myxococcales bacterium]|nr:hypothetical protein [Myxococcales bacterium]
MPTSGPVMVLLDDDQMFTRFVVRCFGRVDVGVSVVVAQTSSEYRRVLHQLAGGRAPVVMIMTDRHHQEYAGEDDHAFAVAVPRDAAPGGIQLRAARRLLVSGGGGAGWAAVEALGGRCYDKPVPISDLVEQLRESAVSLARAARAELRRDRLADYIRGEVCFGPREIVQDSMRELLWLAKKAEAAIPKLGN